MVHMQFLLDSTASESLNMLICSLTDPPYKYHLFTYLVLSYENPFFDSIIPSRHIPISLLWSITL